MSGHRVGEQVAPARARDRGSLALIAAPAGGIAAGVLLAAGDVPVWVVAAVGAPVLALLGLATAALSAIRSG